LFRFCYFFLCFRCDVCGHTLILVGRPVITCLYIASAIRVGFFYSIHLSLLFFFFFIFESENSRIKRPPTIFFALF
jgi:hypothetical protein